MLVVRKESCYQVEFIRLGMKDWSLAPMRVASLCVNEMATGDASIEYAAELRSGDAVPKRTIHLEEKVHWRISQSTGVKGADSAG